MSGAREPEGELTFLSVASAPPARNSVVEPKTCACGTTFYRVAMPADGSDPEKWCRACRRRQELRDAARREALRCRVAGKLLRAATGKLRRAG